MAKEEEALVSRRDMATQMSPEGSTHSSKRGRLSFSNMPSSAPTSSMRQRGNQDDVRDVQVDKGTTTDRQSKKNGPRKMVSRTDKDLPSAWNVTEASKNISKYVLSTCNC